MSSFPSASKHFLIPSFKIIVSCNYAGHSSLLADTIFAILSTHYKSLVTSDIINICWASAREVTMTSSSVIRIL